LSGQAAAMIPRPNIISPASRSILTSKKQSTTESNGWTTVILTYCRIDYRHGGPIALRREELMVPVNFHSLQTLLFLGFSPQSDLWHRYQNLVSYFTHSAHLSWVYSFRRLHSFIMFWMRARVVDQPVTYRQPDSTWNRLIDRLQLSDTVRDWLFATKHRMRMKRETRRSAQEALEAYMATQWSRLHRMDNFINGSAGSIECCRYPWPRPRH